MEKSVEKFVEKSVNPLISEKRPLSEPLVVKSLRSIGAAGFEPATSCSRSRRANRAALRPEGRELRAGSREPFQERRLSCRPLPAPSSQLPPMRPGGLEPPAFWSVAKRSIQLSYGRV